jgi:hypothetical protein
MPLLTGDIVKAHFFPLVPLAHDAVGTVSQGSWNLAGWTVIAGGMFLAAWSTYGFETAVCYTGEFKNPKTDTFKAIFYSGLLCLVVFTLVPFTFQGYLGLGDLVTPAVLDASGAVVTPAVYSGMLAPEIYSGMGVAQVMARMVHIGGTVGGAFVIIMLILALVLSLMTSMAGSSRTLYQASLDGWLPKYLSCLQPGVAADVRLCVRAGGRECRLPDFQFPQSECGLDSPYGPARSGPPVARAQLDHRRRRLFGVREPGLHGHGCRCDWRRRAAQRTDLRRIDRAGVRLSPLSAG